MKKRNVTGVIALVLPLAVLLASGCGPTATNTNVAVNQNAAVANSNANAASKTMFTNPACNAADIQTRLTDVRSEVAKEIVKKPKLQEQITKGVLKYSIQLGAGTPATTLDMYVGGYVGGKDNFIDLIKIIGDFVKGSCTNRVVFGDLASVPPTAPAGTTSPVPSATALASPEFEWFACEEPKVPCPGGLCQEVCGVPVGTATPPPAANTNSNHNSNTKP